MTPDPDMVNHWPIISVYSRKEAIEDGEQVLVDPKITNEAGFKVPVYMTRSVWGKYVEVPKGMEGIQDLEGRLWDILIMLRQAASKCESSLCVFLVSVTLPDQGDWESNEKMDQCRTQRLVTLVSEMGPIEFDNPAPCICIMLPNED